MIHACPQYSTLFSDCPKQDTAPGHCLESGLTQKQTKLSRYFLHLLLMFQDPVQTLSCIHLYLVIYRDGSKFLVSWLICLNASSATCYLSWGKLLNIALPVSSGQDHGEPWHSGGGLQGFCSPSSDVQYFPFKIQLLKLSHLERYK